MQEYILPLIQLFNTMSPFLLLGFLFAGILHEFVPQKIYRRNLSKSDFRSVFLAALFGVPLPLCSCGVLPTAMSLRREGVSKGATTSFLISTPQTGVDSIVATASIMGVAFALIRPIAAFVTAIIGGSLVNKLCGKEQDAAPTTVSTETGKKKNFVQKCIGALKYGYVDMLQDVGRWIVVGLVVAGIITVLVPNDFFTAYSNVPILNMFIVLLFSIPMYLCATGSIPIAAALMLKGLSPGAALVLLMAGPATSMASILVAGKVLGRRTLAIYLLTIIIGAISFGLIIDYLLPPEWFATGFVGSEVACCSTHTASWLQNASSILLLILLAVALVTRFSKPHKHIDITMQKSFRIKGMMCNHCKANVEKNLAKIDGVTAVRVELSEGIAYIDGNFDATQVIATINELGYEYIGE